jgi:hypothetical protein
MQIKTDFCTLEIPNTKLLSGTCYLISPYTKNPQKLFPLAVSATELLLQLGLDVFSPVIYGHTIVTMSNNDLIELEFWYSINELFMRHCDTFAAVKCSDLIESKGCQGELQQVQMEQLGKAYYVVDLSQRHVTAYNTPAEFLAALNYGM